MCWGLMAAADVCFGLSPKPSPPAALAADGGGRDGCGNLGRQVISLHSCLPSCRPLSPLHLFFPALLPTPLHPAGVPLDVSSADTQ